MANTEFSASWWITCHRRWDQRLWDQLDQLPQEWLKPMVSLDQRRAPPFDMVWFVDDQPFLVREQDGTLRLVEED